MLASARVGAGGCACEDWAKPAPWRDLGRLSPPPGSVLPVNSVLCPGSLRGHEGMCEKILCQVSIRGAVGFPPVFLLPGPVLVALSLAHHHSPVGFPCFHRHPVYTDSEAVCSDRPHALVAVVRATTPGARGGPAARLLSPRGTSPDTARQKPPGCFSHEPGRRPRAPARCTSRPFRSVTVSSSCLRPSWLGYSLGAVGAFLRGPRRRRRPPWAPRCSSVLLLCRLGRRSTARNCSLASI